VVSPLLIAIQPLQLDRIGARLERDRIRAVGQEAEAASRILLKALKTTRPRDVHADSGSLTSRRRRARLQRAVARAKTGVVVPAPVAAELRAGLVDHDIKTACRQCLGRGKANGARADDSDAQQVSMMIRRPRSV